MNTWMFERKAYAATGPQLLTNHETSSVSGGGTVSTVVTGASLGAVGGFFAGRIAGVAFGAATGGPIGAVIGFGVSVGFGLANSGGAAGRYRIGPTSR